ncbi:MAG: hypothetical protein HY735_06600 [Verrucomicrobia bacterium]|nr:hypothetical protein [Verrucomicrobiota bacterium]
MNIKKPNRALRQQARNTAANKRLVRKIKRRGCSLCRETPPDLRQLQFHHLISKTKKRKIAHMMWRSMTALVAEIRKCRLLCEECHGKHHRAELKSPAINGGEV